ncbi:hypothetical protein GCM10028791_26450 [Echinicola sediminis]
MNLNYLQNILTIFLLLVLVVTSYGQVRTEPAFPRADQKVKIIYDVSQGSSGLEGVDQVYIHIGAVTDRPGSTEWGIVPFEWGSANEQAQMSKVEGESDSWEYELTPNAFFSRPNNETIYRLGMVFRNADGSKEGKTESNGDFFVDLAQGFEVSFVHSSASHTFLEIGEELEIKVASTAPANLQLTINGKVVAFEAGASSLHYLFHAEEAGEVSVLAEASQDGESAKASFEITVIGASPVLPLPEGVRKGINYMSESEVVLVLEAPGKRNAFVIGDFNDWEVSPEYQMNQSPDGALFWVELSALEAQKEYIFQYLVDGEIRIADPYADKISDPFHDQEIIAEQRYPGLKAYPEGQQFQASYLQTAQAPYDWKYTDYEKPSAEELVIYELLVRDFDERRTYEAVTERLDYLQSLGVNALELMPVTEFEGNLSWGYNPSFFFAPDKYYGTKNQLKRLIDEAHKRGIVVILDMVLNHAFGQSPFVRLYNEGDYGAPTEENPWLNPTATHPYNVGYDFNHESTYTKSLVDSVCHYWMAEYHVDGYRFDLSKGFTQQFSGEDVGKWSQKDDSRIAIWKRIYDGIQRSHPGAYVILEHLGDNSEEKILSEYGMLLWGNMNHTFREMAKGLSKDFSYAYASQRGWAENHLVSYMESHDEERTMWETLNFGDRSMVDLRVLKNAVNRNQLLAAFYFGIPGPKMIWQFGEFGYDEELNDDRLGIKPTHWEYLEDEERLRLLSLYKAMIRLKTGNQVLNSPQSVTLKLQDKVKSMVLEGEDLDLVIAGNFGLTQAKQALVDFPREGRWFDYITGEDLEITGSSVPMDFEVNGFRIFTSEKLERPTGDIYEVDLITAFPKEIGGISDIRLYPVPASHELNVRLPENTGDFQYRILDMSGKVWLEGVNYGNGNILAFQLKDIRAGLYIFELSDNRQVLRKQFIIK